MNMLKRTQISTISIHSLIILHNPVTDECETLMCTKNADFLEVAQNLAPQAEGCMRLKVLFLVCACTNSSI